MVYEPREDSFLLKRNIAKYAKGIVCDMGTGSGVLAEEAALHAEKVYAVDIDPEAIQKNHGNIRYVHSDLFSRLGRKKFDLVIFNPPYLPDDRRVKDTALDGGRHGYEVIGRFLHRLAEHLTNRGKALLLFSSLTNKAKVEELVLQRCLSYRLIDSLKLDFEELYVFLIEKPVLLLELEKKGLRDVTVFARGHRGIIYTGRHRGKKIAVKAKNPSSLAVGRIGIETIMLEKLNLHGIGPRLLFSGDGYFAYDFVRGDMILDYIKKSARRDVIRQLRAILKQLETMDKLGIDKEEMHHPVKHIIIGKKPVLIDFERAHHTERPKNITQFLEFLARASRVLKDKSIIIKKQELITLAREYSNTRNLEPVWRWLR